MFKIRVAKNILDNMNIVANIEQKTDDVFKENHLDVNGKPKDRSFFV